MPTPPLKPPAGPPPSAGVLGKLTRAYATKIGVAEGRVRAWIAYMVLAGVLERSRTRPDGQAGYRFTLKGGVALELRLKDRARATKDLDLVLHDDEADLVGALEDAAVADPQEREPNGYQGFKFRRKREPIRLDNGTINVELAVTYRGGTWTSISVDVARAEAGESEVELIPAIPLSDALGIGGPEELPCLPLRLHIAQKLHGMTLPPREGRRNERFKDLIDLMLMEELVTDYSGLREACETVFASRNTHGWPPLLEVPDHWVEPYARMARELELPVTDTHEAMARVRAFVDRINAP